MSAVPIFPHTIGGSFDSVGILSHEFLSVNSSFSAFLRSASLKNGLKVPFVLCLCGHFKKYNFFQIFFGIMSQVLCGSGSSRIGCGASCVTLCGSDRVSWFRFRADPGRLFCRFRAFSPFCVFSCVRCSSCRSGRS